MCSMHTAKSATHTGTEARITWRGRTESCALRASRCGRRGQAGGLVVAGRRAQGRQLHARAWFMESSITVSEALLHAIWKPFIRAIVVRPFQSFWSTPTCLSEYFGLRNMSGERAQLPKIMWQAVMKSGKRRPCRPSAHLFIRFSRLFSPRYLRRTSQRAG